MGLLNQKPNPQAIPKPQAKPSGPVHPPQAQPQAQVGAAQAGGGQQIRKLKKGELIFAEGEKSTAMYFLRSGVIRLFKKKGDASIELDTIHSGQVLGELAFLDGNPRSASGEALTDCELIEISGQAFQNILTKMPDWLKILLKTVVGRLRTASTRIRQLETVSTQYSSTDRDGKRTSTYVYLSTVEVLKILSAILLVASRAGKGSAKTVEIKIPLVLRYANQIMGVPQAKVNSMVDVLTSVGLTEVDEASDKTVLKDIDFVEQIISYLNEENLQDPSKRHDLTNRGFVIMNLIAKNMGRARKDPTTGESVVNIAEIHRNEAVANGGKEAFRMDDFSELVRLGYAGSLAVKSETEATTAINLEHFNKSLKLQHFVKTIEAANEQKNRNSSRAKV